MYLEGAIFVSKILEHPEDMDRVENPYVLIKEDQPFWPRGTGYRHTDMMHIIDMLHGRGWETVNIAFYMPGVMAALLKNPRAKSKSTGEI